ncbi:MAG TPA: triphosphoribosyl-dephospho-CoA synthase [Candidatus Acidoferrales bacterium]|nr:triphosphoribosyl-dephospho-CoA synthase [Candidatus Acidoferrales bacterium]
MRERPRPHDLVRLSRSAVARLAAASPSWAVASLRRAPWAAVRRAHVDDGIAIGIRGEGREQRLAAVVAAPEIEAVVTPEMLAARSPQRDHGAFDALAAVMREARAAGLAAGPIGAAGFELATGVAALHATSDLDVVVRTRPGDAALRALADAIAGLPVRVDVEISFANDYGAALEETLAGGELLVKTPDGPRLLPPFSAASAAVQALIAEAELTPKPALVDRRGSGAHDDLNLALLLRSAHACGEAFERVASASHGARVDLALRERLGAIGRDAERRMLEATGNVNAHRGAIWSLGLLVAAHASSGSRDANAVARVAAEIAALPDANQAPYASHGKVVRARFGVRGAAGEAQAGFPHVVRRALPALRASRARGASESVARTDALLAIMTTLDDTCLLHRGGEQALRVAQRGAAVALAAGGIGDPAGMRAFEELESALLALRASPGGAADLLAAALFLDSIERGTWA